MHLFANITLTLTTWPTWPLNHLTYNLLLISKNAHRILFNDIVEWMTSSVTPCFSVSELAFWKIIWLTTQLSWIFDCVCDNDRTLVQFRKTPLEVLSSKKFPVRTISAAYLVTFDLRWYLSPSFGSESELLIWGSRDALRLAPSTLYKSWPSGLRFPNPSLSEQRGSVTVRPLLELQKIFISAFRRSFRRSFRSSFVHRPPSPASDESLSVKDGCGRM